MNDLEGNLHDWTLQTISVDWIQSKVWVICKGSNSQIQQIQVENFIEIYIPKKETWGKSQSINQLTLSKKDNHQLLQIEMQSGDTLIIEAKNIELI